MNYIKKSIALVLASTQITYAQSTNESGTVVGQPVYAECGFLEFNRASRADINSHQQAATRLTFPSNIEFVANAATELWDATQPSTGGRNLWVRPKTSTNAGRMASISVQTSDGRSYDFLFTRAENIPQTTCYTINDNRTRGISNTELQAQSALRAAQAERDALERQRAEADRRLREQQQTLEQAFTEKQTDLGELGFVLQEQITELRSDRVQLAERDAQVRRREAELAARDAQRAAQIREDDLRRTQLEFEERARNAEALSAEILERAGRERTDILSIAERERTALDRELEIMERTNQRLMAELIAEREKLRIETQQVRAAREAAKAEKAAAESHLETRFTEISQQARVQARDAISAFKYTIHTTYDWEYSAATPDVIVSSVYDDGRRTYVRIENDAFGAPVVIGTNDRGTIGLNYRYDDLIGVYEIQGLYREMELRFDADRIVIRRKS